MEKRIKKLLKLYSGEDMPQSRLKIPIYKPGKPFLFQYNALKKTGLAISNSKVYLQRDKN